MKSLSFWFAGSGGLAVRRWRSSRFAALCALFICSFSLLTLAQEGTIVGTVTDPTGSVVPNATITITSIKTGQSRTLKTNESGQYVAPDLAIGEYNIQAHAPGFKIVERKNVVLNVADRARIDFAMQMGAAQETVTVEANAVRVQTDSGEVSDVITGQQVSQLTTNGRSIYTLVNLTPGASSLQADFQTPTPVGGDANVSFNGQRPGHTIYLMDGGENLDRGGSGTFSVMPSIESLAEFRVLSSNYSAEYGLSSSATMTTVLKSGTKTLHASAWEFLRNDALDARNYFNRRPQKVAELRFNTYGFNVGGPVDFWKSDHKTFFFYNMEWRSLIQGQTLNQTVPVASEYPDANGAGTGAVIPLTKPNGKPNIITVPTGIANLGANCPGGVPPAGIVSGAPFPNNTIPSCMIDPNAAALLAAKIFPLPTSGNQFQGGNNAPTNVREEVARADHQFNDKVSIFGHWVSEQINQTFGTTMWSGDNVPTIGNTFGNPSYSAVVHLTHTISSSLLNEVAFNYNGNRINILPKSSFGAPLAAPSGFTFNRIFTGPNADNRIPTIKLQESTGTQYTANWTPWVNKADDYQIRDDISWTRGAHQFKIGASWAVYKKIQDVFASTQGNFGFNGAYTGFDFADFLLGYTQNYSEDAVHDNGHWNNASWAAYFQDNWRFNQRLTLNLGLRWDGVPHTYEANHRSSNFYPNLYNSADAALFDANGHISPLSPGLGTSPNPILAGYQFYLNGIGIDGKGGIPKGLVDNHWAAFGPRIGFAYDLTGSGKTVLRGGFGTMYERIQGNDMYNGGTNVPFSATASFNNVSLSDPHTNITTGSKQTVPIVVPSITGLASNNYNLPVSYQYSFGVQQALGAKSVLSVSYVGNQTRHQNYYAETNLVPFADLPGLVASKGAGYNQLVQFPGFRSIRLAENGANGHYNSLQLDLHANVRRDLMAQFGYTYSQAIDAASGNNGSGQDLNVITNPYVGWRYDSGPSVFDRTNVAFVNFVYDIPAFKGSSNRLLKTSLGGWQLSGIVTMQSGAPLNVTVGGSNDLSSILPTSGAGNIGNGNRPDLVGKISYPKTKVPAGIQWFDPTVFAAPAPGTFGTLPHNALRGPGRDNWNMALHKMFVFSESRGSSLEFRAEAYNMWNHTQFRADVISGNYGAALTGSNFGVITQAYDPRVFQLGLKLTF
ncbi:MAG: hypothetical protein DMG70_27655 [Acidobacteria bacterium]|nr:MAG: hypothetical protein DMG70_27655 [Acidobacteriota bacterium]